MTDGSGAKANFMVNNERCTITAQIDMQVRVERDIRISSRNNPSVIGGVLGGSTPSVRHLRLPCGAARVLLPCGRCADGGQPLVR